MNTWMLRRRRVFSVAVAACLLPMTAIAAQRTDQRAPSGGKAAKKLDPPRGEPFVLYEAFGNQALEIQADDTLTLVGLPDVESLEKPGLVFPYSKVQFKGKAYNLAGRQGVYRFMVINDNGEVPSNENDGYLRSIIYIKDKLESVDSLLALLSGISTLHIHGVKDNGLFPNNLNEAINSAGYNGWLIVECGWIVLFGQYLISGNVSPPGRLNGFTIQANASGSPPKDYDKGHIMFEVRNPEKIDDFILVDLDLGLMFKDSEGEFLDAYNFYNNYIKGNVKPFFLSYPIRKLIQIIITRARPIIEGSSIMLRGCAGDFLARRINGIGIAKCSAPCSGLDGFKVDAG